MGIVESIKEKIGNRVSEYKENRQREKNLAESEKVVREHEYRREYGKARIENARAEARAKAKSDADRNAHPTKWLEEKLKSKSERYQPRERKQKGDGHHAQNKLGRNLTGLGDFGRSIGRQYENMEQPSWIRDFNNHTPSWLERDKKKGNPLTR